MNYKNILLIILLMLITIQLTAIELISLQGNPIQGGIVICRTDDSIEKIFLDHTEIPIFENRAIFGFDRDEKLKHKITVVLENGSMFTSVFYIFKRDYQIQRINGIKKKYVK